MRDLLDLPTRRRILDVIRDKPGIKITDLCRETGSGWGTVKYHLHLLEKAGLVLSRPTARDRLLFASDFPEESLPVTEVLRQGRAEKLAIEILREPGVVQKDLCERVQMTRKIIRRYIDLLESAGLVSVEREARFQRHYPGPRLVEHLAPKPSAPSVPEEPKDEREDGSAAG
ncbi:MAG: winged helix-turn-helix transcriptional regulator [Methanobacteriota archaeon]